MINIRERVLQVLEETHLMSLGTIDDGGVWVSDLIFIYDKDFNLYWMSNPNARHAKAIAKNGKVAGTITYSVKNKEYNLGVQFEGTAEHLAGLRLDLALKHLKKRGYSIPSNPTQMLEGYSWYKLHLEKIELIDEENFGFEKKELTVNS